MALIECPECKNQMSDQAKACPHCGAPRNGAAQGGNASMHTAPTSASSGARPLVFVVILVVLAFLAWRMTRTPGLPASATFAVDNAGGDESCTVLGDYCMRVRCAVTNTGAANGVARLAADFLENNQVLATRHGTSRLLASGEHDTLVFDFPEATLASQQHQYKCYPEQ